jgi:hypothetical protein
VQVEAINIGPSDAIAPVGTVSAVAGQGLEGDRHFFREGAKPGHALTLIEAEVLEDVGLTGPTSRRQVVVRGVRLHDLIGKRFRVGDVECVGVEICEPCLHLQQLTRPGIIKDMVHRGGLNADIVAGGRISVGDAVSLAHPEDLAERAVVPVTARCFVRVPGQPLPRGLYRLEATALVYPIGHTPDSPPLGGGRGSGALIQLADAPRE